MNWNKLVRLSLGLALFFSFLINLAMAAKIETMAEALALYRQLDSLKTVRCQEVYRANEICVETITDIAARLGLDNNFDPLVATALWNRRVGTPPSKARKLLKLRDDQVKDRPAVGGY